MFEAKSDSEQELGMHFSEDGNTADRRSEAKKHSSKGSTGSDDIVAELNQVEDYYALGKIKSQNLRVPSKSKQKSPRLQVQYTQISIFAFL